MTYKASPTGMSKQVSLCCDWIKVIMSDWVTLPSVFCRGLVSQTKVIWAVTTTDGQGSGWLARKGGVRPI